MESVFVNKVEVEKPRQLIDTPREREWEEQFAEALGCVKFSTNGIEEAKEELIEDKEDKSILVWENGEYYIVTYFDSLEDDDGLIE